MPRIIFLSPFVKTEISGGIKTSYQHAELLSELGFDAVVCQPDGRPSWFDTKAKVIGDLDPAPNDILVFPETLNGPLAELIQSRIPGRKVLFSQAHYYALFSEISPQHYRELGFERIVCQSEIARGFLQRVLNLRDVAVIPCYVDTNVFFPRPKILPQVALIPRKLPREAAGIQRIFMLKYPDFAAVGWEPIENRSERETAEIFGRSAVVLSLPFLESFGLVPLEAMASGAIVAGFTGGGANEYATKENGFWFPPDHLEETADAVARIIKGFLKADPEMRKICDAGFATVAQYSKERTRAALKNFYGSMLG